MANVANSQWLAKCKRVSNVDALSSANVVNGSSDDAAAAAIGEARPTVMRQWKYLRPWSVM